MKQINFNTISEEEKIQMYSFFEQSNKRFWTKNKPYFLPDNTLFVFTNDIFKRNSKNGNRVRYEVIGAPIGDGGCGLIYNIEGTITLKENSVSFKTVDKSEQGRVVKKQDLTNIFINEVKQSKKISHLAYNKEPLIIIKPGLEISYSVMRKQGGKDLYHVNTQSFTTYQKILLFIALLEALKEQVIAHNIVHRDLKPENIMVNMIHFENIEIRIIDYAVAMNINEPDGKSYGTCIYMAPEIIYSPMNTGSYSDIYSMGRVCAEIFGVAQDSYPVEKPINKKLFDTIFDEELRFKDLFNGINDLNSGPKKIIGDILKEMLCLNYSKRMGFNIDKAINKLKAILPSFKIANQSPDGKIQEYTPNNPT